MEKVLFFFKNQPIFVDELVHYQVVKNFCQLGFKLSPHLTNIPGYHVVLGLVCFIINSTINISSLAGIRFLSLIFSLAALPVFYLLAKKFDLKSALLKTWQVFVLPLALPFYFLVYTDIPALGLVLAAFYLTLTKKYLLAGLVAILSVLFRQNNIVWLVFLAAYVFWEHFSAKIDFKALKLFIKSIWVFILGVLGFGVFVYLNGGVSLAAAEEWAHPAFGFYLGNIYLMLFLFFILFLPLNLANFSQIRDLFRGKKGLIRSFLMGLFLVVFLSTFRNTHPYNQHTFALHNWLLVWFTKSTFRKVVFFVPVLYSLLSILVTRLHSSKLVLLYPFTVLFLIPSWLIEPRYYIVPFVFYQLFRKSYSKEVEISTLVLNGALSVFVLAGILTKTFFP